MRLSTAAWAELRAAYETGAAGIEALAAQWGVKPRTIRNRARRETWLSARPKNGASHDGIPRDARRRASATPARPTRREQEALLARLYRAITWKLEDMEARMTSGDLRSAQDEEREARALGSLISNFEKVTDVVLDFDKSSGRADRAGNAPRTGGPDADAMRREIAERLERLTGGGNPPKLPRDP